MPASTKMFLEQSQLTMPPSVWLHVNGVSLTADIHHYNAPVRTYDYQTKHLQSPAQTPTPPLIKSPTMVPCSITTIDGPFNSNNNTNRRYQRLEHIDLPKKLFIDRHIKKAKSLPGLIKGTALSRHTPLNSSTFPSPAPINPLINKIHDDQLPHVSHNDNDETVPQIPEPIEQQNEIRRPRVYFADFNKINFFEDNIEISQQQQTANAAKSRRHRHRSAKKFSMANLANAISPSIQQTQILNNTTLPLSHHPVGQELNVKKQQLITTQRSNLNRSITHLPDILNQTLPSEHSSTENSNVKYTLQREKPLTYFPKPVHDLPVHSSMDVSSDHARIGINHPSPRQDLLNRTHDFETLDNSHMTLNLASSSINSPSNNRQRSLLHSISLRQQFHSPIKLKATGISSIGNNNNNNNNSNNSNINNNQQQPPQLPINTSKLSTYRSNTLKCTIGQMCNDQEDLNLSLNKPSFTKESRPLTASGSARQIKRSDVIHFRSKSPFGFNGSSDASKQNDPETNKRFQNLLTVVRPPYASSNANTTYISSTNAHNDYSKQEVNHNQFKGTIHTSRSTSARGSVGLHISANTIIV